MSDKINEQVLDAHGAQLAHTRAFVATVVLFLGKAGIDASGFADVYREELERQWSATGAYTDGARAIFPSIEAAVEDGVTHGQQLLANGR